MESKELLKKLCEGIGVSAYEDSIFNHITEAFQNLTDEIQIDNLGNIVAKRNGQENTNKIKIMLAAHMDEIGLMVKDIDENGFVKVTSIGGIDPRTLLAQEIIIHGRQDVFGVIGAKPPHLSDQSERSKAFKMEDLTIDIGLTKEDAEKIIEIGDIITIKRDFIELKNNVVAGKALDDRAGIVTMYECAKELLKLKHEADVYFVSTVQEEVGVRGATTSTFKIDPDIGIAIDVGFGATPELPEEDVISMGKGAGITLGGNIHPTLRKHLIEIANEYNISFQHEITPGLTGTDGRAMIITKCGIPTLVISLPLRYMHTSVETIDMNDVKTCAQLLARFIASISSDNLEGLLCY